MIMFLQDRTADGDQLSPSGSEGTNVRSLRNLPSAWRRAARQQRAQSGHSPIPENARTLSLHQGPEDGNQR